MVATERNALLKEGWPICKDARIETVSACSDSVEFSKGEYLMSDGVIVVDGVFVCFDHEAQALSAALTLHRRLGELDVPLVVRVEHSASFSFLTDPADGDAAPEDSKLGIRPFGLVDHASESDLLLACDTDERMAYLIHKEHLRVGAQHDKTAEKHPDMRPWREHLVRTLPRVFAEAGRRIVRDPDRSARASRAGCGAEAD